MGAVILLLVLGSSIWVGVDASNVMRNISQEERRRISGVTQSAAAWAVGCILLWIVIFPIYLITRPKYIAYNQDARRPTMAQQGAPRKCASCGKFFEGNPSFCPNCGQSTSIAVEQNVDDNFAAQIRALAKLRQDGIITQEEFNDKKRRILES